MFDHSVLYEEGALPCNPWSLVFEHVTIKITLFRNCEMFGNLFKKTLLATQNFFFLLGTDFQM
jgi:hypothetical protein